MKAPVLLAVARRLRRRPLRRSKADDTVSFRPTAIELLAMPSDTPAETAHATANPFTAVDVAAILREEGWLDTAQESSAGDALLGWLARAAELLGPHAEDRAALAGLLRRVFHYDAGALLRQPESQAVLARTGAREVIRELANRVLEG